MSGVRGRVVESHEVRLRGRRWLWAKLRRRSTRYTVIDRVEVDGVALR